jgi:hypothetical protein
MIELFVRNDLLETGNRRNERPAPDIDEDLFGPEHLGSDRNPARR